VGLRRFLEQGVSVKEIFDAIGRMELFEGVAPVPGPEVGSDAGSEAVHSEGEATEVRLPLDGTLGILGGDLLETGTDDGIGQAKPSADTAGSKAESSSVKAKVVLKKSAPTVAAPEQPGAPKAPATPPTGNRERPPTGNREKPTGNREKPTGNREKKVVRPGSQ
jgi:hypothetical protein